MIHALTLDLDDTLWPVGDVIARAEAALQRWFGAHAPRVLEDHDATSLAQVRRAALTEHPELAHDFSALRRRMLAHLLTSAGYPQALVEPAFEAFFAARNDVALFDEVENALRRLAARFPILAVTNGNADLERIAVGRYFLGTIHAREVGALKPDRAVFDAAVARLGIPRDQICHAGDHLEADVFGARDAGLQAVWVNRVGAPPAAGVTTVTCLAGLADLLDC